jgi:uncharacterized protein YjbI with pentapeptide repeats
LSGADLSNANINGAHLIGANLAGANISYAHLGWANLSGANLSGTNLDGANLRETDLSRIIHTSQTKWPAGFIPPKSESSLKQPLPKAEQAKSLVSETPVQRPNQPKATESPTLQSVPASQSQSVNRLQRIDTSQIVVQSQTQFDSPTLSQQSKTIEPEFIKKCPYCAEIIKADARFCRFCGKDLTENQLAIPSSIVTNRQLLEREIAKRTSQGWQIVSQTETSVQLRKPKRWSKTLLILGLIFLLCYGGGLLFWLLALIDYAIKKDQVIFLTIDNLQPHIVEKQVTSIQTSPSVKSTGSPSAWRTPMILAGGLVSLFVLCIVFSLAPAIFLQGGISNSPQTSVTRSQLQLPTARPLSTPTHQLPLANLPIEIQEYGQKIAEASLTMGDALGNLGELLQTPNPFNDDWKIQVATQMAIIRVMHEELEKMNVPPQMEITHAAILDATGDCNASMDYLARGIDNMSTSDLDTANDLMISCSEKIPRAKRLFEEYMAQFEQ